MSEHHPPPLSATLRDTLLPKPLSGELSGAGEIARTSQKIVESHKEH
jgi:hypothetical protein